MRVLAAVVTYNRLELLERCVQNLRWQTYECDILVINNGSTDGTREWLLASGDIFAVHQENVGSAGGWFSAIKFAREKGYDAIWLMDDDGYPAINALRCLVSTFSCEHVCVSSVVVCENDPQTTVFDFPCSLGERWQTISLLSKKTRSYSKIMAMSDSGMYPFAHFFNGALFDLNKLSCVGNVNVKYFMFGDEVDYFYRCREIGKVETCLNAYHYHPDVAQRPYTRVKVYYYIKNSIIISKLYMGATFMRPLLIVLAALYRVGRRSGHAAVFSYILDFKNMLIYKAFIRGILGMPKKDFDED